MELIRVNSDSGTRAIVLHAHRYGMEYSRWDAWTPDDPATREETDAKEVSAAGTQ
jgi:hypothetical protein